MLSNFYQNFQNIFKVYTCRLVLSVVLVFILVGPAMAQETIGAAQTEDIWLILIDGSAPILEQTCGWGKSCTEKISDFIYESLKSYPSFDLERSKIYISNTGFLCLKGEEAKGSNLNIDNIRGMSWSRDYVRPLREYNSQETPLRPFLVHYLNSGMSFCYRWSFVPVIKYFGFTKLIEELGNDGFLLIDKINVLVLTDDKLQNDNWEIEYKVLQNNVPELLDSSISVINKYSTNPFNEESRGLGTFQYDTTLSFSEYSWQSRWNLHKYEYVTKSSFEGIDEKFDLSEYISSEVDSLGFDLFFPNDIELVTDKNDTVYGELDYDLDKIISLPYVSLDQHVDILSVSSTLNEPVWNYEYSDFDVHDKNIKLSGSGKILVRYEDELLGQRTKPIDFFFEKEFISPFYKPFPLAEVLIVVFLAGLSTMLVFRFYCLPRKQLYLIYSPIDTHVVRRGLRKWKSGELHHVLLHLFKQNQIVRTVASLDSRVMPIVNVDSESKSRDLSLNGITWLITSRSKFIQKPESDLYELHEFSKGASVESIKLPGLSYRQDEVTRVGHIIRNQLSDRSKRLKSNLLVISFKNLRKEYSEPIDLKWSSKKGRFGIRIKALTLTGEEHLKIDEAYQQLIFRGNGPKYLSLASESRYRIIELEARAVDQCRTIYESKLPPSVPGKIVDFKVTETHGVSLDQLPTFATKYIYLVAVGRLNSRIKKNAYLIYDPFRYQKTNLAKNWLGRNSEIYRFCSGHLIANKPRIANERMDIELNHPPLNYRYTLMMSDSKQAMSEFLKEIKADPGIQETANVFPIGKVFEINRPNRLSFRLEENHLELSDLSFVNKNNLTS